MRILIYLLMFCSYGKAGSGQTVISSVSGRSQYAGSCTSLRQDVFNAVRNPAAQIVAERFMGGVQAEKPAIPGLTGHLNMAAAGPLSGGHWGVQLEHRGLAGFGETQVGIGYGMRLSDAVSMGLRFNYYRLWIAGYGSAAAFPVEWGAICRVAPGLKVAMHLYNPFGARLRKDALERLPVVVRFCMGYTISEKAALTVGVIREEGHAVGLEPMIHYQPEQSLFFRFGFVVPGSAVIFSTGFSRKGVRMEFFVQRQGLPGWVTGLGIHFQSAREGKP
jgi:hypothetical protein